MLLLLLVNFVEWIQVGIDVYIPLHKYEVKPHSATCAAAIVHRNHFFRLYQQYKFSESKAMFRQGSNCFKRMLEAAKLAYAKKTRVYDFPGTWLSELQANCYSVINQGKSAIPPLFDILEVLSSASDKAKLFS